MKKELNTPVFYFLAMCRGHPWTSHIDVDPENFQRLQLISKASLKGWALIFLAFDFLSSNQVYENITMHISLQPFGDSWMKSPVKL